MIYKHITVSLPPVPMGQPFDDPFKQTLEAEREYAMALDAPELLAALQQIVDIHAASRNPMRARIQMYDVARAAIDKFI